MDKIDKKISLAMIPKIEPFYKSIFWSTNSIWNGLGWFIFLISVFVCKFSYIINILIYLIIIIIFIIFTIFFAYLFTDFCLFSK